MSKTLICYFSASGVTKRVAEKLSQIIEGDLFEIEPKEKYTKEDLDWMNQNSRSSIEMADKSSRPEIQKKLENIVNYQKIIIGFPVWWYTAPTIINTFIEENDLIGKELYVFVTSGGSSQAKSFKDLQETFPNLNWKSSKRLTGSEENQELQSWINT